MSSRLCGTQRKVVIALMAIVAGAVSMGETTLAQEQPAPSSAARTAAIVECAPPRGDLPGEVPHLAVLDLLTGLADAPAQLEDTAFATRARRALVQIVSSGVPFSVVIFDLSEEATVEGDRRGLSMVIDFRCRPETAAAAAASVAGALRIRAGWEAGATPGTARVLNGRRWQVVSVLAEGPVLSIALGENALERRPDRRPGVGGGPPAAQGGPLMRSLPAPLAGWNLTAFVDLDAVREAWPESAGFGRIGRLLHALGIPNMRAAALRASLPLAPEPLTAQSPPRMLSVVIATAGRGVPRGAASVSTLSSSAWPVPAAQDNPALPNDGGDRRHAKWALVVRPEWGEWIRGGISAFGACEGTEASRRFDEARRVWEVRRGADATRRVAGALAPSLIIEPAADGVLLLTAPTRDLDRAESLALGIQAMVAGFVGPGSKLDADSANRRWGLSGTPCVLLDGVRAGVVKRPGAAEFRVLVDVGNVGDRLREVARTAIP
ncbi:MAG: hypothetical protein ACT4PL_06170 [Phycisphaerales bacterium]